MDDEKLIDAITGAVDDEEARDALAAAMADDEVRDALSEAVEQEALEQAKSAVQQYEAATAASEASDTDTATDDAREAAGGDAGPGRLRSLLALLLWWRGTAEEVFEDEEELEGPAAKYAEVRSLVDQWEPPESQNRTYATKLRTDLDRGLNDDVETMWERDVVETRNGRDTCDVIVNGVIGVKFVHEFSKGDLLRLSRSLQAYASQHQYLIVYVHGSSALVNRWRILKRKYTAERLGVEGFDFVIESTPGSDPNPRGDGRPNPIVPALTGLVTLVGIALVVFSAFVRYGTDVAAVLGFVMVAAWLVYEVYVNPVIRP
ncbi:hypothetical protein [Haloarchaeobius amylolyticus]|uniref:hypothetical protein n=1 Tax=Haloarchaeobius amylolyticus TaxID=1198296 RepID=UPI0022715BBA|nr:hypothetical protein [Haloarchaeobius amylolyticus]